ncbi:pentatricopeptide repeat-containing protein At1g14470 [Durio zibethinus]|uniref:Pentatricopeptide repeat-containing protein At1g14470 n=1 Tax=Durio zibethinus TaxID=66656 RepID=A0A6P5WLE4_DURZI|nr:pentatricopeptide repeat-containing protein At1g14470 [Durio zibethinus]
MAKNNLNDWTCWVQIAGRILNQTQLKQLHAQLIQNSLHHRNHWVALLINSCARLRAPLSYTRIIFHSTPSPNLFALNSMVEYYFSLHVCKEKEVELLTSLFSQLLASNNKPGSLYPILIKSSGKAGILFHVHLLKLGHHQDPHTRNAIMNAYSKFGSFEMARKLFDEIPKRMVADWNSMISGYWNCGMEAEACSLFNLMPENERNVVTWTAMVTGYAKIKDLFTARSYFDRMPHRTVVSWNAMLSGYAQNGLAKEALQLFHHMIKAGNGTEPNQITWVTVISSCSSLGDPSLADSLVKILYKKKVQLNSFLKTALLDMHAKCGNLETAQKFFDKLSVHRSCTTWNAMISAYTRFGNLALARELFDRMPVRNIVSWNTIIAGFAQNGHPEMAIRLFEEMIATTDLKPDEITMVSVISACGHLGDLEMGNWIVNFLVDNQIKLSISGYNSLIFMYSKCGRMEDAERIFQEMKIRDIVSFNVLVSGFAAHGNGIEAVELISRMRKEGIEPDRITYIGVLTACSHARLLKEGRRVFESIKCPTVDHYACMIDLLGRVGELDEAKRLVDHMPMEPHAGIYGSLLNASVIHKRIELGEFAANKLFQLEPTNSGNYVLLSNIYASAERWDDVDRVRESMRKLGVKKTTRWTWVEHDGKVHKVILGDRSYER